VGAVKTYADAVNRALKAFAATGRETDRGRPKICCVPPLERCKDDLLNYIGSINWETEGLPDDHPGYDDHPFGQVFCSLGILKQDLDDMNRKNRDAAVQLETRHAQLRALTQYLIHTEEREKRRIADDLHDGLAQVIAILISKIKTGKDRNAPLDPGELHEIQLLLEQALRDMRTLSFELNPPVLERGLVPGLDWLAQEYRAKHGITLDLDILDDDLPVVDETLKIILYRAVHELIRNVQKHSGATAARITFRVRNSQLIIRVEDAGRGFDTSTLNAQRPLTFGLFSISERLRVMGGQMTVVSEPGKGTSVTLLTPPV
jgi:signal transduction histidine kinase